MKLAWLPTAACMGFLLFVPSASTPKDGRSSPTTVMPLIGDFDEVSGCGITLRARYDTRLSRPVAGGPDGYVEMPLGRLFLDLTESKVRIRNGTWASLAPRCSNQQRYMWHVLWSGFGAPDFRQTCNLDFGCNYRRRYRFLICAPLEPSEGWDSCTAAGSVGYWKYYPSADGWTEETEINLGDLGQFFPELQTQK
jgi:hypothetical protein